MTDVLLPGTMEAQCASLQESWGKQPGAGAVLAHSYKDGSSTVTGTRLAVEALAAWLADTHVRRAETAQAAVRRVPMAPARTDNGQRIFTLVPPDPAGDCRWGCGESFKRRHGERRGHEQYCIKRRQDQVPAPEIRGKLQQWDRRGPLPSTAATRQLSFAKTGGGLGATALNTRRMLLERFRLEQAQSRQQTMELYVSSDAWGALHAGVMGRDLLTALRGLPGCERSSMIEDHQDGVTITGSFLEIRALLSFLRGVAHLHGGAWQIDPPLLLR